MSTQEQTWMPTRVRNLKRGMVMRHFGGKEQQIKSIQRQPHGGYDMWLYDAASGHTIGYSYQGDEVFMAARPSTGAEGAP